MISNAFLLVVVVTGYTLLRLELTSKVNSKPIHTQYFYFSMSSLYLMSFFLDILSPSSHYPDDTLKKSKFFMIFYLLVRFMLIMCISIYSYINKKNVNGANEYDEEIPAVLPLLSRREGLQTNSTILQPNAYKLLVIDKTNIVKTRDSVSNIFTIKVKQNGKQVSTVKKSYQDFKTFQNQLNNFLKAELNEFPTLERGYISREYSEDGESLG